MNEAGSSTSSAPGGRAISLMYSAHARVKVFKKKFLCTLKTLCDSMFDTASLRALGPQASIALLLELPPPAATMNPVGMKPLPYRLGSPNKHAGSNLTRLPAGSHHNPQTELALVEQVNFKLAAD